MCQKNVAYAKWKNLCTCTVKPILKATFYEEEKKNCPKRQKSHSE